MLIFGFGPGKAKDLGEVAPVTCPNCHNSVFLHRVQTKKSVRLYFVPVVPYGTDEYLLCPVCTQGIQVDEHRVGVVNAMQATTTKYHTGRIPEDAYLAEVTRFFAQMGMGPTAPPLAPPPAPIEAAGKVGDDWVEKLAGLEHLHQEGVLTDNEFAAAKQRLIGDR